MDTTETYALAPKGSSIQATQRAEKLKRSLPSMLLSFIYNLDAEFPLSGGETPQELSLNMDYLEHESALLMKGMNDHFPLAGG